MNTFTASVRNEIRMLWRRRSFWIVFAIPLIPAGVFFIGRVTNGDTGVVADLGFLRVFFMLLLPALIGSVVNQDAGGMDEILGSTNLDSGPYFAGRYVGLLLGLLPGILFHFLIWWILTAVQKSPLYLSLWRYGLPFMLITLAVGIGGVLLLGKLLRNTILLIVIWTVLWLILTIKVAGLDEFIALEEAPLLNVFFHSFLASPSLGLGLARDYIQNMVFWFIGMGLFFAWLALIISTWFHMGRAIRNTYFTLSWVGISLLFMAVGSAGVLRAQREHAIMPSAYDIQADNWVVRSHKMDVQVDMSRQELSGSSTLIVDAQKIINTPQIVLRLNPGIQVISVQDAQGNSLEAERIGDSAVISYTSRMETPLRLDLTWAGKLRIPYSSFGIHWEYYFTPVRYNYGDPQPLMALMEDGLGFLLRDGDWYPWPWVSGPRQAENNQISIQFDSNVITSAPLQNGKSLWQGQIPSALAAFPPQHSFKVDGITVLAAKQLDRDAHDMLVFYARSAQKIFTFLGEDAPQTIAFLPYLGDIYWSGDMLLIPDGSGHYLSPMLKPWRIRLLLSKDPDLLERTLMADFSRVWARTYSPPQPVPFIRVYPQSKKYYLDHDIMLFTPENWKELKGRWTQPVEILDVAYFWGPRRNVLLTPEGGFSAVGFWISMELADERVRQEDLKLIDRLDTDQTPGQGWRDTAIYNRGWSILMQAEGARHLVRDLHLWSQKIGTERALSLTVEALRQQQFQSYNELIDNISEQGVIRIGE